MKRLINDNYHCLSTERDKHGGGVLLLVAKTYAASCFPLPVQLPDPPDWFAKSKRANDKPLAIDIQIAKLRVNSLPRGFSAVIAVCVYLAEFGDDAVRQRAAMYQLTFAVEHVTSGCKSGTKPLIFIAGDFNGADTSSLCHALQLHKLSTAATHKHGRTLDLILTNAPKCYSCEIWEPLGKSDHSIIYGTATQAKYNALLPKTSVKLVRSGRICETVNVLRNTDWASTLSLAVTNKQLAADNLYYILKAAEDLCQPLRPLKSRNDQPWMTAEIKQLIAERQTLFRKGARAEYKAAASKASKVINARKRIYYRRKFSGKNTKYWTLVNSYRGGQSSASDDAELANALNEGFYSVWGGIIQPDLTFYLTLESEPPTSPLFTPSNVTASLSQLNPSSPGPDGVSAKLLKSARLEICNVISTLFNRYLTDGFVPSQWLTAHITPIAKVDHPSIWSDYRPISLTSNLCKAFERVVANYIVSKTLAIWATNRQHGFLPGRSTMDAVVQVLFDIGSAADRDEAV